MEFDDIIQDSKITRKPEIYRLFCNFYTYYVIFAPMVVFTYVHLLSTIMT